MFVGPWELGGEWRDRGLVGISRWLNRLWSLVLEDYQTRSVDQEAQQELRRLLHKTIKRVTHDMEQFRFNVMLAALMKLTNYLAKMKEDGSVSEANWAEAVEKLLLMLAPSTPHLAEELWQRTGHPYSIHDQSFPSWDESLARDEEITLVIQVNGKLRDKVTVPVSLSEAKATKLALGRERVQAFIKGKQVTKVIYVPGRLVNIVVR
jgi:leucyl-tRNA synthetase